MSAAPLISFSGVSLYINERLFLDRIDLSVPEGETLVIAGPAGCGKSLVIRLVMGMPGLPRGESVAIDGTVQVDGVDLIGMSAVQLQLLRSQIGSVLRGGGLIDNMDVLQNITLPLNYHFRDVIGADAIAARCQLLLETLGQGHLDQPGRRPVSLNREEKVYVALARAFVTPDRSRARPAWVELPPARTDVLTVEGESIAIPSVMGIVVTISVSITVSPLVMAQGPTDILG